MRETNREREREIVEALSTQDAPLREQRALVRELRGVGGDASVEVLRVSVRSEDVELSGQAARTLGRIGTDDAVDALVDCLELPYSPRLGVAASALRKLRSQRAMPAVLRCLETRSDELPYSAKRVLILALGEVPHISQVPVLSMALRDRGYRMRNAAAWALAQIRAPESAAALEQAAKELSWFRSLPIRRGLRVRKRRADEG